MIKWDDPKHKGTRARFKDCVRIQIRKPPVEEPKENNAEPYAYIQTRNECMQIMMQGVKGPATYFGWLADTFKLTEADRKFMLERVTDQFRRALRLRLD